MAAGGPALTVGWCAVAPCRLRVLVVFRVAEEGVDAVLQDGAEDLGG